MRIVFLSFSSVLPNKTGNGSSVLMYGFINILKQLGHKVIVVPVSYRGYRKELEKDLLFLNNMNFETRLFDTLYEVKSYSGKLRLLREIVAPNASDHYYIDYTEKSDLISFIWQEKIDLLIGYAWEALAVIHNIDGVKKMVSIVDLLNHRYTQRKNGLKQLDGLHIIKQSFLLKRERKLFQYSVSFLKEMDIIIEHAYQHAEEIRSLGFDNVTYFPHPLPVQELNFSSKSNKTDTYINVLILGSLKGISSRLGFEFLLNKLLPRLKQQSSILHKPLKFRIVGHGEMLPSLKKRIMLAERIDFIGFAESIEEEYQIADIMLVTIPISHGFRTRIAEAFSFGMCVVAHAANAEGMPEIKDGYNALTASDPNQLADKLISAANDPILRYNLGKNAKKTFDEKISQKSAVKKVKKILENLSKVQ